MPPVESEGRITIVGGGAMGALFAALLARAGAQASILDASETVVDVINRDGLTVEEPGGRVSAQVAAATTPEELSPASAVSSSSSATRRALRSTWRRRSSGAIRP